MYKPASISASDTLSEREPLLRQPIEDTPSSLEASNPDATSNPASGEGPTEGVNAQFIDVADKLRILAVVFTWLVSGMNLTVVGAMLPELEEYYSITDSKAALIFTTSTVGYICGTLTLTSVVSRYGWRGVAFLSPFSVTFVAAGLSTAPPFVYFLLITFLGGLGTALLDAGFNAWASRLAYVNVVQGLLHGSYSVGSVLGPVVYAGMVKRGLPWYIFYRAMLVVSLVEMAVTTFTFWTEDAQRFKMSHVSVDVASKKSSSRSKVVLLIGLFYFFYISVETSFYNWMPSFMRRIRHTDLATASLSSSVFWVGMAIGRVSLGMVTEYFGLKVSVTIYLLIAIGLQIVFRFVTTMRASFVLLGLSGFILGPMYPSGIILISKSLSIGEYIGGVAVATALGQVGGCLSPLVIGFMAENFGLKHLTEVILASMALLLVAWLIASRITRMS